MKPISVGLFCDPDPSDKRFDDMAEALTEAKLQSGFDSRAAIAVWYDDKCLRVFLRGYELRPV